MSEFALKSANIGLLLCAALVMLTGCKSYLAFGTATTFGLDASQRADQTVDITMGYKRLEIASIPVGDGEDAGENGDASATGDAYSVLGSFHVHYGNPFLAERLILKQLFATGMAARAVAQDAEMQKLFGEIASEVVTNDEGEGE